MVLNPYGMNASSYSSLSVMPFKNVTHTEVLVNNWILDRIEIDLENWGCDGSSLSAQYYESRP